MCLAIPGKITTIKGTKAIVDYGGIKREADISLVNVKKGDFILVHAGFAIQKLEEKDAIETLKLFEEILENA
jgi:hydrogenase expression/formation protein HypC